MAKGIDVSKWQGNIDWAAVKAGGVAFAMLRASVGTAADSRFAQYAAGATAVGIPIGAYHYLTSTTAAGAKREADFFLSQLAGKRLEYPAVLDLEEPNQLALPDGELMALAETFLAAVEEAGYYAMLYASLSTLQRLRKAVPERLARYDLWCARWGAGEPGIPCGIWQYEVSKAGAVPGVSTDCDRDLAYKDYPFLIQAAGLNHLEETEDTGGDLAALRQELLETKAQLTQVRAEKEDILRRLRKLVEEYGE